MANDTRDYTIKVTKPGTDYVVELYDGSKHIGQSDPLVFNKTADGLKKTAHYKLNFKIDDSSLSSADKVRFAPADSDVMWVSTDTSQCPPSACHMDDTFWVDKNNNGQDLRLINMDLKKEDLRFKINLVKRQNHSGGFIELDPIITNGNSGSPEGFSEAYLLIGAVAGGIAALGTLALTNNIVAQNGLLFGLGGALVGAIVGLLLGRR